MSWVSGCGLFFVIPINVKTDWAQILSGTIHMTPGRFMDARNYKKKVRENFCFFFKFLKSTKKRIINP